MNIDLSSMLSDILFEASAYLKEFFSNLVKAERMKESDEYSDNPEEAAQIEEEINATGVEFTVDGTSIAVSIVTSGSNYDTVSTEGKETSYSGGTDGIVTEPDGTTRPSLVPEQLQGQPVPDSEEPPSIWKENAIKMIKSLLPDQLQDYIKSRLSKSLPPVIGQYFSSMLTGGVV